MKRGLLKDLANTPTQIVCGCRLYGPDLRRLTDLAGEVIRVDILSGECYLGTVRLDPPLGVAKEIASWLSERFDRDAIPPGTVEQATVTSRHELRDGPSPSSARRQSRLCEAVTRVTEQPVGHLGPRRLVARTRADVPPGTSHALLDIRVVQVPSEGVKLDQVSDEPRALLVGRFPPVGVAHDCCRRRIAKLGRACGLTLGAAVPAVYGPNGAHRAQGSRCFLR
jgi:hypothetical protein